MPTYGYLHGQHVTVNLTEATFDSVAPGVRHVIKIAVRNISMRGQRVRMVPPRQKEFTLIVNNDVELAPGLEMTAELHYYADDPADVESELWIQVGRAEDKGEVLVIPVHATLPGAKLVYDHPVDFGVVMPGHPVHRSLVVSNKGTKDGKMMISPAAAGEKFSVKPLSADIRPGESATFQVELNASETGLHALKLPVTIKGQAAFFFLPTELELTAHVADCTCELQDASGAPLSKSELGRLYCGLQLESKIFLANKGPKPVNFALSRTNGEEGGIVEEPPDGFPITAEPAMGRVPPHGKVGSCMRMACVWHVYGMCMACAWHGKAGATACPSTHPLHACACASG